MNTQDWFPLGLNDLISLWSKDLSRVFSNTTVQNFNSLALQPFLFPPHLFSSFSFLSPPPTLFLPSSLIMAVSHLFTLGTGLLLLPTWVVAMSSQVFSLPISPSCNFSYPVQSLRHPAQDHTPERSHSCNMTSLLRCVSVLPLLYRSAPSHRSVLLSMVPSLTSYAPAFSLPGLDCMPMCLCAHTDTQHGELFFPAFYRPSSQSESLGKEMDECLRQEELKKNKILKKFIYLAALGLTVAHRIFSCGMWNQVPWPSSLRWEPGVLATRAPGTSTLGNPLMKGDTQWKDYIDFGCNFIYYAKWLNLGVKTWSLDHVL